MIHSFIHKFSETVDYVDLGHLACANEYANHTFIFVINDWMNEEVNLSKSFNLHSY